MKQLVLSLLFLTSSAFAGYQDWDDPQKPFPMTNNMTNQTNVIIMTANNVSKACEEGSRIRNKGGFGYKLEACSFWDKDKTGQDRCLIIVGKTTSMHTLGHEMMHCLKGNWH